MHTGDCQVYQLVSASFPSVVTQIVPGRQDASCAHLTLLRLLGKGLLGLGCARLHLVAGCTRLGPLC
jgi:hypothetical protein